MRVERVRYFLAAVEAGSIRSAASRCGISQPSLGQQITLLEEEIDIVLLTRSRRGVVPTPAGQALLEPMEQLVAAQDALHGAAMEARGSYSGTVRIGGGSATVANVIAPVVGMLREQYPELRFSVREEASADIESGIVAGDLDIAVITEPEHAPPPGLRRTPLFDVPIGGQLRADHPLSGREYLRWRDLRAWPIVTMRPGTVLWDRMRSQLPEADVVIEAMSARTVRVMVARGAGIGVLAGFDGVRETGNLRWIPISDAEDVRICLVERSDIRPSASSLVVRRLLQERAAQLGPRG
ncbi:DNA-binding transcriptional LysR family regulator [Prauserella isguenensis]|uniref:DNA-binding transcriptional LysR family regulator n=1 Tax=Prauserella isguenensis TaxID=1470180 RepID=A0A839RWY2_9PSEU|nr:DNA-binding transcriptional LysR family regulator [Prauserella isguenensis]